MVTKIVKSTSLFYKKWSAIDSNWSENSQWHIFIATATTNMPVNAMFHLAASCKWKHRIYNACSAVKPLSASTALKQLVTWQASTQPCFACVKIWLWLAPSVPAGASLHKDAADDKDQRTSKLIPMNRSWPNKPQRIWGVSVLTFNPAPSNQIIK